MGDFTRAIRPKRNILWAHIKMGPLVLISKKTPGIPRGLNGAGEENRTLVSTLARSRSTIEPRPQKGLTSNKEIISHFNCVVHFYFLALRGERCFAEVRAAVPEATGFCLFVVGNNIPSNDFKYGFSLMAIRTFGFWRNVSK